MAALHAYENKPAQWSIKFEVRPTTGAIYFRRFHYAKTEDGWECEKWSEDPEHPERTCDFAVCIIHTPSFGPLFLELVLLVSVLGDMVCGPQLRADSSVF